MRQYLSAAVLAVTLLTGTVATAADEPLEVVRNTTEKVLDRVKNEKQTLRADPAKMYNLVAETIFPHFDFAIMSQWVLGTQQWKNADAAVRRRFVDQFRKLLVRTYATALLEFSNQTISYPPIDAPGGKNTAVILQEITQPGGEGMPIIYRLHNRDGGWKVYDVSVDGVSLVKTYRASFTSLVRDNGIEGLISTLATKNQDLSN